MARGRKKVELPGNLRGVLAKNVQTVMEKVPALGSQPKLATKGIGQTTVGRIARAETAVNLDNLEELAAKIKVQPWQLLVPNLDPTKIPALRGQYSLEEGEAMSRLQKALPRWRRYVMSLAMETDHAKQQLFLDMFTEHVPDERVAEAYGKPGEKKP